MPAGHDAFDGNGHSPTGPGEKKEEEKKKERIDGTGERWEREGRNG